MNSRTSADLEFYPRHVTRRRFFQQCGTGMGALALASLLNEKLLRRADAARSPRLRPSRISRRRPRTSFTSSNPAGRRTSTCSITKPELIKRNGQKMPDEMREEHPAGADRQGCQLLGTNYKFASSTASRACGFRNCCRTLRPSWTTSAFVQGFYSEAFNHDPATLFMNTGAQLSGRPSMGSWFSYGLGSENKDLPGLRGDDPPASASRSPTIPGAADFCRRCIRACSSVRRAIRCCIVSNPPGMGAERRRQSLDAVQRPESDALRCAARPGDRDAHRRLRNGVSDADQRAGSDGHFQRAGKHARRSTRRRRAGRRLRTTVCSPAGWSNAACASCSCITAAGIITAVPMATRVRPQETLCRNRSTGGCPDQGPQRARAAGRNAGHLGRRIRPHADDARRPRARTTSAAIIIRTASPSGWPAAASSRASSMARPTTSASTPSRTRSTSTTCTPRSCTCFGIDHTQADLPIPRPRLPPDRRAWRSGEDDPGVSAHRQFKPVPAEAGQAPLPPLAL